MCNDNVFIRLFILKNKQVPGIKDCVGYNLFLLISFTHLFIKKKSKLKTNVKNVMNCPVSMVINYFYLYIYPEKGVYARL